MMNVVDIVVRAHILAHNVKWHQLWPFDDREAIDWPVVLKHLRDSRRLSYPKSKPCADRWAVKRELYAGTMPGLMMNVGPEHRHHGVSRTDAAILILEYRAIVFHDRIQFIQDAKDYFMAMIVRFINK